MAAVEGTPRRVKTLLLSFLQSSDVDQEKRTAYCDQSKRFCGPNSNQQTDVEPVPSTSMCQPRSKEAFWARVETFSPFTWFAKPLELSPLHCALYGWENSDVDILQCVSCKASLDATMSTDWDPEIFAKSCQQLKDSLVIGHSKLCPWPDNPCPENFIRLPALTQSQWKEDFILRWHSLLSLGPNLPSLDNHVFKEMDEVSENHIKSLQALLQATGLLSNENMDNLKQILHVSCLIGLCGWQKRNNEADADQATLFCTMCRRELGVWNFRSITSSDEENQTANQDRSVTMSTPTDESRNRSQHVDTSSTSKISTDDTESMDLGAQAGTTCSTAIEEDQYRGFAGCKRTNTGHRNMASQRHDNSKNVDIEECMDIEVKLKLHVPGQEDTDSNIEQKKQSSPFERTADQIMKSTEMPMNVSESETKESTSTFKDSLLMKRFVTGRDSPLRGSPGADSLPYRSPLHLSVSDLSEKEHCESLCVEVEEESLIDKLQAVESELEFMAGGSESSAEKDDYAPDIKRIRLEDLEKTKFHPISEHRSWCPWVSCGITGREKFASSQESGNGWRMLLRTILPSHCMDRVHCFTDVPPKEAWIPVRRLLNECSSVPSKKKGPES